MKPYTTCDDLASTEAEGRRGCELEQATLAVRLFTAATDTTATDTAQETHTQTTGETRKRRRTRCGQEPPSQAQKSLASVQKHLHGIARRNRLIDEYIDKIQKYRTAKMEVDHQRHRVEWVRSEVRKIEAEQKVVVSGKSDGSETRSRKRGRTDNAIMEPLAKKQNRLDETEKTAVGPSDNSRTTRGKKRELFTDEDTLEP